MKNFVKVLACCIGFFLLILLVGAILDEAFPAVGGLNTSWSNPTTKTDGAALAPASITQTRIEYGTCSAAGIFGTKQGDFKLTGNGTAAFVPLAAGTYCVRLYTSVGAAESAISSVTASGIATAVPPPPPPVPKTVDTIAYKMRQDVDGFTFVPLGSVPKGTVCGSHTADAFTLIPRAAVTLASRFDTLPLLVFAKCQ